jgi:hypothetical protein
MTVNANAARATHPHRDTLCPTTGDSPVITDTGMARGEDRCPHHMPGCPGIRCQRPTHDDGLCWSVRRDPYAAAYWEAQ